MATEFPTTAETRSLVPPFGADGENNRDDAVMQWVLDSIIALQAKVGADSSGIATSHDKLITDDLTAMTTAQIDILEGAPYTDTQLNAAAINGLRGANVELLAAPAAGLTRVPIAVYMFLDHGGADFVQTNGADHLALLFNGGSEIAEIASEAVLTAFLEASADAVLYFVFNSLAVGEAAESIDLDNNGAADYATGNGTLSIRVWYRDVPFAAFV